jgi:uncharacterized protein YbaR (Trm112 family)
MSQHGDDPATKPATNPGANPDADTRPGTDIDPKLLELLVHPLTHEPLQYDRRRGLLIAPRAGVAFPIRDGVPILLLDEAETLDDDAQQDPAP